MPANSAATDEQYEEHIRLASQAETLYREVEKVGGKKPTEILPYSVAKKINHLVKLTRKAVGKDPFLDAVEPLAESGAYDQYGEAVVVLAELRTALDHRWDSPGFRAARRSRGELLME